MPVSPCRSENLFMPSMVLLKEGRPLLRLRLEKLETVVGRDLQVDLYIPDARVSRRHAVVRRDEEGWRLIDKSSNGTYLNQVRTRSALLHDQDLITLGACQLRFEQYDVESPAPTLMATREQGNLSYDVQLEQFLYQRPVLLIEEPGLETHRVPLRSDTLRIGSAQDNDVRVSGLAQQHLQLLSTEDGYILRNLEPSRPAYLNNAPLGREEALDYGTLIRLGRTQLRLELEQGTDPLVPLKVSLFEGMVGTSPAMHRLFALVERFSRNDAPAIILGETGSGKELVARALHTRGHRARGPFVAINCSALSPQLFESELFGHMRGAFTGAVKDHLGAFEMAHKGTLFLDELGELPLELQAKLLRTLETSTVTPVGSSEPRPVQVRVVTATHRDLRKMVQQGLFREDLFFRLYVLALEVPPLRARREDILPLAQHFLQQLGADGKTYRLAAGAQGLLERWDWPGNVRELRHTLTRAVAASQGSLLQAHDITFISTSSREEHASSSEQHPRANSARPDTHRITAGRTPASARQEIGEPSHVGPSEQPPEDRPELVKGENDSTPSLKSLDALAREVIVAALDRCGGNRTRAARMLGIARSTLHLRMQKLGIQE